MTDLPDTAPPLDITDLHGSLSDPTLSSMTFLNEIAQRYPDAVSFAPGRPYEGFFEVEQIHRYLRRFEHHLAADRGMDPEQVRRTFFQYGRTKGVIHDLIAANLAADENIHVPPESIVVTVGCQEAMFLTLRALRTDDRDAVVLITPAYVGLVGAARLVDMPVIPVRGGPTGVDLTELATAVRRARTDGLRPRACYLVPDFANPSGITLDVPTRRALLDLAEREDFLLLEDNPYGLFSAGRERLPTLKSMDCGGRVVYLGSYAKSGLPGARIGFAIADQAVTGPAGRPGLLADELAKIKSMVTVNTSPIAQAVIAGRLLENDGSLTAANKRETEVYRGNLDRLLAALSRHFPGPEVTWNVPGGGFFLVMELPIQVTDELAERSARDFGVLWTPMHHFYVGETTGRHLRLSYSLLTGDEIDEGVKRLAVLLSDAI